MTWSVLDLLAEKEPQILARSGNHRSVFEIKSACVTRKDIKGEGNVTCRQRGTAPATRPRPGGAGRRRPNVPVLGSSSTRRKSS